MIIKSFEIKKINLDLNPYILLHGKNDGLKKKFFNDLLLDKNSFYNYDEKEILENTNEFIQGLNSKSFFETKKIIIIKRGTDKIISILSEIISKNYQDTIVIVISENLEKKSKLRIFFEKEKNCICVAFYPDNNQTLMGVAYDFLKKKNIIISSSDLNLIIERINGDREALLTELEKIEFYTKNSKKITSEKIAKLTNLIENYDISELVDNCLANNKKKTEKILIENKFNNEDCIIIIRTFLNKLKKILNISQEFEKNKNLDLAISSAKPPIFWKHKDITKKQILNLSQKKIFEIIYELNKIELNVKKNYEASINIISDFIFTQISKRN
jgi:DNA polymerase-3 subunit delta